ncbi:hypothetical protein C1645_832789 [Glomus cerebriforme]|uniref:Uncharacterized protein n=1 Tax=Glomus cerebriforme TaxID=658196 RepID=A0A397SCR5_9GLOM|nr:hypothetical protein C1645_832789 [Glomus cerebriforme]
MVKDISTIYICLWNAKSTGYSLHTNVDADLFERKLKLISYNNNIININEELWNCQMDIEFCNKIWTDIQKRSANWNSIEFKDVINLVDFLTNENSNNDVCFLLYIDETRVLISPITRYILSRISNFTSPKLIDPSSWNTTTYPLNYFIHISDDSQAIDKLKNLLRQKLLGEVDNFIKKLIVSHMATCLSVLEDREWLIITYSSELLLSEIALDEEEFMKGTIVFTHFTAIDYVPTKKVYTSFIQEENINSSSIKADKNYSTLTKLKLDSNYVFKKSNLKVHNEKYLYLYWQLDYYGHNQEIPNHISTHQNPVHDEEKGDIWNKDKIKIMHPLSYNCSCSNKISKEKFAEIREAFQVLSKSEQDIFSMAQLIVMDGGIISNSKQFKKKTRSNKRTFYHWNHNTLLYQKTYFNMLGIGDHIIIQTAVNKTLL